MLVLTALAGDVSSANEVTRLWTDITLRCCGQWYTAEQQQQMVTLLRVLGVEGISHLSWLERWGDSREVPPDCCWASCRQLLCFGPSQNVQARPQPAALLLNLLRKQSCFRTERLCIQFDVFAAAAAAASALVAAARWRLCCCVNTTSTCCSSAAARASPAPCVSSCWH